MRDMLSQSALLANSDDLPVGVSCGFCVIVFIGLAIWVAYRIKTDPPAVRYCQLCGNLLKEKRGHWTIDGVETVVCAHCNARLERKNSANRFKDKL